jgi:hypothetical protein
MESPDCWEDGQREEYGRFRCGRGVPGRNEETDCERDGAGDEDRSRLRGESKWDAVEYTLRAVLCAGMAVLCLVGRVRLLSCDCQPKVQADTRGSEAHTSQRFAPSLSTRRQPTRKKTSCTSSLQGYL